jgi:hypothetical protein
MPPLYCGRWEVVIGRATLRRDLRPHDHHRRSGRRLRAADRVSQPRARQLHESLWRTQESGRLYSWGLFPSLRHRHVLPPACFGGTLPCSPRPQSCNEGVRGIGGARAPHQCAHADLRPLRWVGGVCLSRRLAREERGWGRYSCNRPGQSLGRGLAARPRPGRQLAPLRSVGCRDCVPKRRQAPEVRRCPVSTIIGGGFPEIRARRIELTPRWQFFRRPTPAVDADVATLGSIGCAKALRKTGAPRPVSPPLSWPQSSRHQPVVRGRH